MKIEHVVSPGEAAIDPQELSIKDLKVRWAPASPKTVQRKIRRLKLQAYRLVGSRPRFRLTDVLVAEERERETVNQSLRGEVPRDRILTVQEARTIAGRKRRAK